MLYLKREELDANRAGNTFDRAAQSAKITQDEKLEATLSKWTHERKGICPRHFRAQWGRKRATHSASTNGRHPRPSTAAGDLEPCC